MKNLLEIINERLRGAFPRRAIASLLVAAECFSVVTAGVPAVYAEDGGDLVLIDQAEENAWYPQEDLDFGDGIENLDEGIEPVDAVEAAVSPAEAAELGAQAAEQAAYEAELAAYDAAMAAYDAETSIENYAFALDAAGRAAEAARRAEEAAQRASDEAAWALDAYHLAEQEAQDAADEANAAAVAAEEAARELEAAAEEKPDDEKADGGKDEKPDGKPTEKPARAGDTTPSPNPTAKPSAKAEKDIPDRSVKTAADKTDKTADRSLGQPDEKDENDADRKLEIESLREKAEALAAEAEQKAALAAEADEEAARAWTAADRAAQAANSAAEAAETARDAGRRAAEAAERAAAYQAEQEENTDGDEVPAIEEPAAEDEPAAGDSAGTDADDNESISEDNTFEALNYTDETVTVTGEVPTGVSVEAADVLGQYLDFDPASFTDRTVSDMETFGANASEDGAQDGEATAEDREYTVLAAYDITLLLDGEEYQPEEGRPLEVSIAVPEIAAGMELRLWHIHNDGSVEEIEDFTFDGSTVTFTATGFSVYVLTGVKYLTFKFYVYNGSTWVQYGAVTEQRIKNGEKPQVPLPPSDDELEFSGWYRSKEQPAARTGLQNWNDANGNGDVEDGELTDEPYDFDNIPAFTQSSVVNLYAGYDRIAHVVFHDQYDSEAEKWPVAFSRRVKLKKKLDSANNPVLDNEGNPIYENRVQISDLKSTYSGSENLACYGWSYTPVETPGVYKDPNTGVPYAITGDGFITVSGDVDLYPIYRVFHRLTFYTAGVGEDADYVPAQTKFEDEGFGEGGALPGTSRPGYVFRGWYIGTMGTVIENGVEVKKVLYGSQVTDGNGKMTGMNDIPYLMTPVAGVSWSEGKLFLAADATLYAKWEEEPKESRYQLVFWKQSRPNENSYVYYTSVTLPATGTNVSFDPGAPLPEGVVLTGYTYSRNDGPKPVSTSETVVLNVYYDLPQGFVPEPSYILTYADSLDGAIMTAPAPATVGYNASLSKYNTTPENKKSDRNYVIYTFNRWYMDRACTIPVNWDTMTMPACDVTVYAGWKAEWFIVNIDPNYGALFTQKADGSLEGTGSTWFWQTWESELIGEYTHVTRDYVRSSGGDYYYVNRDRTYYGYSGNEWDNSEEHRETFYTKNPGESGAGSETFEYAPGSYSYVGWYEVYPDGSEAAEPYDFTHHTDHDLTLRLRWKRDSQLYLAFDAGSDGYLNSEYSIQREKVSDLTVGYADQAAVTLNRQVFLSNTSNKVFIGWRLQGDTSGVVYPIGGVFTLHTENAKREGGKDVIWLEAVYADSESDKVTIVYDANGGIIGDSYDSGKIPGSGEPTNASGVKDGTTVTVHGLTNNSEFIFSDGTGFSWTGLTGVNGGNQIMPAGWSNARVFNPDDPATQLYIRGEKYGVDINGGKITNLYAAWPLTVTYDLNNVNGSWNPSNWGDAYTSVGGNYKQTRYIGWVDNAVAGCPVLEPVDIPTDSTGKMFYYWTEDATGPDPVPYDFSKPVTKDLTLYAVWDVPVQVPVHAVDASEMTLVEKPDWVTVPSIPVVATPTELDASTAAGCVTALPDYYTYAFAVALNKDPDRENVSEADRIEAVYYNQAKKHLYVHYADASRADAILEEGTEIYFLYYKQQALNIHYVSMDANGVLAAKTQNSAAPTGTGVKLGEYDVTDGITEPMNWVSGYSCYAYALGAPDAANASKLRAITETASSDDARPALRVKNSWQGFLYSTDGGTSWKSCGYGPDIYVVYFENQPTVIMLHEETRGTNSVVLDTAFTYHIVVTKVEGGVEDTAHPVYDSEHVEGEGGTFTQHIYAMKNGDVQSAVLFYSSAGGTDTAQKITVTQNTDENTPNFTTTIGGVEKREWTCTSTAAGGTVHVIFTNTHKALTVDKVHVALVSGSGVTLRDDLRSENHSFQVELGKSGKLLDLLPSETIFNGGEAYALGAIGCGRLEGTAITALELGLNTIAYGQVSGNYYKLLLNGDRAKELGDGEIFYLYYPASHISYKKRANGTLTDVTGYEATNGEITYGSTSLEVNGVTVEQNQLLPIPVNGVLRICQIGSDSFRMPPYLDDGNYLRYLSYVKLGYGDSGKTSEDDITPVTGDALYLRVGTTGLQRSLDGKNWEDYPSATPTIYAIYEERGYDLMITKTVPAQKSELSSLFMDATFTVIIESDAITKDKYPVEGYDSEFITADSGRITLTVGDGSAIRILGLSQGNYTVSESRNENYELTAKMGRIVGGTMSSVEVNANAISFELDSETKLALTNTPHRLCRIVDNGLEHIFFTFADAIKYIEDNITSLTATVEMLSDYTVPLADRLTIPHSYNITLDNAAPIYKYVDDDGADHYFDSFTDAIDYVEQNGALDGNRLVRINYLSDDLDPTKLQNAIPARYRALIELRKDEPVQRQSGRTITRSADLTAQPMIESEGRLTIRRLTLNGASLAASKPLIQSADNLTIGDGAIVQNGKNTSGGGAVNASAGNVTVSGSAQIIGNEATGDGGAIHYSGGGTVTVSDSAQIRDNETHGSGGAIYAANGTVTITGDAQVKENRATGNGGAIYGMSTVVNISQGVTISENRASSGGAVYVGSGSVTVKDYVDPATRTRKSPKIQKNRATGDTATTGFGGAIYVGSGSVTVKGGVFGGPDAADGNTAKNRGGAICVNSASVTLETETLYTAAGEGEENISSAVTVWNNQAPNGGAIYATSGAVTVKSGTVITENKATTGNGGAIYADSGNLTLSGASVTKNGAAEKGGAIYAESSVVTIRDSVLGGDAAADGNTAKNGGAVYVQSGTVTVSGSDMKRNAASEKGGAVYAQNGNVTVTMTAGKVLAQNTAKNGGAIYAGKGTVSVSGGEVRNNEASANGGAFCTESGSVTLTSSAVIGNRSTGGHGGAAWSETGSVSLVNCTTVTGNTAPAGNGGVICTDKGSVTVSGCTVNGTGDGNTNTAQNGGVVYTASGAINVTDSKIYSNKATYIPTSGPDEETEPAATGRGGALCTVSGSVTISGSNLGYDAAAGTGNSARNGGAIFAESGNITVSGRCAIQENTATMYGGAIYEGSGTVTVNGTAQIDMKRNSAVNGAAVFVESGTGVFSGGTSNINVKENKANTGGAVGVGVSGARLYFSGKVYVNNNTHTQAEGDSTTTANVYLDQDTDSVINAAGLNGSSEVGIYVPGPFSEDLFKNRGAASALFGSYSNNSNLNKFMNDRNPGLTAKQADNNKIQWVSMLTVEVRYLESFGGGFPPTDVTALFTLTNYVMPSSQNGASQIAEDLYANYETAKLKTPYPKAGFACVFEDGETSFDNYLTAVNWDGATGQWKFIRRDGTELSGITKLIVYFADTTYLSIVNNTPDLLTLNISSLSVLNRDAAHNGYYGYVTAKDGMTPDTMEPIQASDLTLAPGKSRKFLFPGAMGQSITLQGTFSKEGGNVPSSIQYIVDGDEEHPKVLSLTSQPFTLLDDSNPYTLRNAGETREFIFGEKALEICLVRAEGQENTPDAELPKFPSFKSAIKYITDTEAAQATANKKYSIEMLVDYLLPSSDKCELPGGYDITLTTADSYVGDRATISRDAGNMSDAIVKSDLNGTSNKKFTGTLTIKNLIFDGRSLAGSGDGGALKTKDANIWIENCLFKGVEATNGGAIYVDFTTSKDTNSAYQNSSDGQATLTIIDTDFINCRSSSYADKTGGGALWTTARVLTIRSTREGDPCTFDGCSCYKDNPTAANQGTAQAGAVFHNIKAGYFPNTKMTIDRCEFLNCYVLQASGGAVESDAETVEVKNCTFDTCYVKRGQKHGGGLNVYANDAASPNVACSTTVTNCTFINCSANQNGGGVRTNSKTVKIEDCTFTKCTANTGNGGGLALTNSNTEKLDVLGCTFDSCSTNGNYGGAIYCEAKSVTIGSSASRITEIKNCQSKNFGGGICQNKNGSGTSFTMTNANVTGNRTTDSTGGGVYTLAKTVTITGGSISNNTAKNQGGGLYATDSNNQTATLTIQGATISGNTSSSSNGGGVWYDCVYSKGKDESDESAEAKRNERRAKMTLTLYGCKIDGNAANNGGGVYTLAKTVTVDDYNGEHASISNNTARNGSGGGIYHSRDIDGSALTVTNAAIKGNESKTGNGGGVWTNARTLTLTEADVSGNTTKNNGGGVYYDASEESRPLMALTVSGCTLDGNTASSYYGGGIYTWARTVTIGKNGDTGTAISNCVAKNGGGVYHSFAADPAKTAAEDASLTFTGSTITGCRATSGKGGGVYTNVRTLTVTDSTVSGCTSSSDGGGVWYDGADAAAQGVMTLTFVGSTVSDNTAGTHGGGVYTGVDTVSVSGGSVSNNTANDGNGGGIHQQSSATDSNLTVTDAEIRGNRVYGGTNKGKGGGVYAKARTATVTGGEISGNTASRNGGGICHDSAAMDRDLFLDNALVKENQAGEKGGGVYFAESTGAVINSEGKAEPYARLTMRNNAQVIDNRLSGSAGYAAGVYLPDCASLYVGYEPAAGEENTTLDTVVIKDNLTTAGHPSDLRLWSNSDSQNNMNSVYVYCGLTSQSEVRVVNANRAGTQFGISGIINPTGFMHGFTPENAVFKADDDTLFGVVDRSETIKNHIIWGGPAICKITDPEGTLLYLNLDIDSHGADPAVFDLLDTGDEADTSVNSAFSLLRAPNPSLYYADGRPYSGSEYCVKMLDSFTTQSRIIIPAGKTITFTTAGRDDDDYPFEYSKTYKSKSDIATVTRGKNVGNYSLVETKADLTLENIILDGGSLLTGADKPTKGDNTHLLYVGDPDASGEPVGPTATVTLKGATLQNSETTGNGGGVYLKRGTLILGEDRQNGDAQIRNCSAKDGGGIWADRYAEKVEFVRGLIFQCAATGSGGGICLSDGESIISLKYEMTGGLIDQCTAATGGGLYAGKNRTATIKGGRIQENHATSKGGGIAVGDGTTVLQFAQAPVISQNTCDASVAPGKLCNVELSVDTNKVIQTVNPGLYNGASIGVYVSGNETGANSTLYDKHGVERAPFGTYDETGDMTTFYSFINDRNGYKGGLMGTNDPQKRIYWVKIFSMEVAIRNSPDVSRTEKSFQFRVTLSGTTAVADQKDAKDIHGYYGQMFFYSDGVNATTALVDLELKDASEDWDTGVSCIGENLSQDLSYVVTPQFTSDKYVLIPQSHRGVIGEFNKDGVTVDESERYISRAVFQLVPAVCKLTDASGKNLLYYWYEDEYRRPLNPNNDNCSTGVFHLLPAVFPDIKSAVEALDKAAIYAQDSSDPHKALCLSSGIPYNVTQGVQIQMLVDHKMAQAEVLPATVPITLTTASAVVTGEDPYHYRGTGTRATLHRAYEGDALFTTGGELTLKNIVLDGRKEGTTYLDATGDGGFVCVGSGGTLKIETNAFLLNSHSTANGGAICVRSGGTVTMSGGTIRYNTASLGSAIYAEDNASVTVTGGSITANTAANGGAVYLNGGTLTMTGGTITGNSAANGGAVYVEKGGTVTLSGGTITGNSATTNGAGIFLLATDSNLKLSGAPDFGGSDLVGGDDDDKDNILGTSGNFLTGTLVAGTTNGGKNYTRARQDIYLAATYNPLGSIQVTGEITSGDGTIWVWADVQDHYEMLKQFAVFSGDGKTLGDPAKETTMKAFRNARPDGETNCGGDYLTGQKGEVESYIYWTGGFDVVFLKTDGYGVGLPGAVFTLYTDPDCADAHKFEMTFTGSNPATDDGKRATTTSSDGTATYKDKNGTTVTLAKGEVLLSKVPPKTFYLKETTPPTGYDENETVYKVTISGSGELEIRRKSTAAAATFDMEAFKVKTGTVTVNGTETPVYQYRILNESALERKVILRKTNSSYASLDGAQFRIFRADLSEITEGRPEGKAYYESGQSGVYFIGTLPAGRYYLLETKAPNDAGYSGNLGKVFILTVNAAGVSQKELGSADGTLLASGGSAKQFAGDSDAMAAAFKSWMENNLLANP